MVIVPPAIPFQSLPSIVQETGARRDDFSRPCVGLVPTGIVVEGLTAAEWQSAWAGASEGVLEEIAQTVERLWFIGRRHPAMQKLTEAIVTCPDDVAELLTKLLSHLQSSLAEDLPF